MYFCTEVQSKKSVIIDSFSEKRVFTTQVLAQSKGIRRASNANKPGAAHRQEPTQQVRAKLPQAGVRKSTSHPAAVACAGPAETAAEMRLFTIMTPHFA